MSAWYTSLVTLLVGQESVVSIEYVCATTPKSSDLCVKELLLG